ncbi:hypothetical protein KM043_004530 [Ampulex compressa]|nr:hypothetical protein KM043_004530 [Ampulex compressa]
MTPGEKGERCGGRKRRARGEEVGRATLKIRDEEQVEKRLPGSNLDSTLFPGVVGARNFTMECRKGRRKGLLGGLVLTWLLTSSCTVVARNIAPAVYTARGGALCPAKIVPLAPRKAPYEMDEVLERLPAEEFGEAAQCAQGPPEN